MAIFKFTLLLFIDRYKFLNGHNEPDLLITQLFVKIIHFLRCLLYEHVFSNLNEQFGYKYSLD